MLNMKMYYDYISIFCQKELENNEKENDYNTEYECVIKDCFLKKINYIITLEFICNGKNKRWKIKEEERIVIDTNLYATVLDTIDTTFRCKTNRFIKPQTKINIRLCESPLHRLYKKLQKFKPEDFRHKDLFEKKLLREKEMKINHKISEDLKSEKIHNFLDLEDNLVSNLNESQRNTALFALEKENYKIIGPPGTGKTTTLVHIIRILSNRKLKISVCGPSNASIDNIICGFITKEPNVDIIRLGSTSKTFNTLKNFNIEEMAANEVDYLDKEIIQSNNTLQQCKDKKAKKNQYSKRSSHQKSLSELKILQKEKKEKIKEIVESRLKNSSLIFSTLNSSLKLQDKTFDYVIIDECCQAIEPEIFLTISKGINFILAGDPFQLNYNSNNVCKLSIFNNLDIPLYILQIQYRMPSNLIEFSNNYFYKNHIKSVKDSQFQFFNESNMIFIDTVESNYIEETHKLSLFNRHEAEIVIKFINYIYNMVSDLDIGVIVPYSAQVQHIKEKMPQYKKKIRVSTVDSFQGQECDIIIISLVRSNYEFEIGFLEDIKRMNVAITRCKKGLVVIGNSSVFERNVFFKKYIDFLYQNAFCIDSQSLEHYFD